MAKTLDDYKLEKRSLEIKITDRIAKNKKILEEIARLEVAYNKMGRIKRDNPDNADKVKTKTKISNVAGNVEWKGEYRDLFDDTMKCMTTPAAKKFFNSIDAMQDEIGKALDKKRGEYNTGSSILNGLNKAWNNVMGIIRNWVN